MADIGKWYEGGYSYAHELCSHHIFVPSTIASLGGTAAAAGCTGKYLKPQGESPNLTKFKRANSDAHLLARKLWDRAVQRLQLNGTDRGILA